MQQNGAEKIITEELAVEKKYTQLLDCLLFNSTVDQVSISGGICCFLPCQLGQKLDGCNKLLLA